MLCCVLTFALLIPFFPLKVQGTPAEGYDRSIACTDPDVLNAGDKFFMCFDATVKNSTRPDNMNGTKNYCFRQTIFDYMAIANKTCYMDTVCTERDSLEFYKFIMFSVKRYAFKDFLDNGGAGCIQAIKASIAKCVTKTIGHVPADNSQYHTLWKKTKLTITEKTCKETNAVKLCTLDAMRKEGWYKCQYGNDNVLFVRSLFEFMLERCTRLVPHWADTPKEEDSFWKPINLIKHFLPFYSFTS